MTPPSANASKTTLDGQIERRREYYYMRCIPSSSDAPCESRAGPIQPCDGIHEFLIQVATATERRKDVESQRFLNRSHSTACGGDGEHCHSFSYLARPRLEENSSFASFVQNSYVFGMARMMAEQEKE